jgi:H-type small acid-soluble spore protein
MVNRPNSLIPRNEFRVLCITPSILSILFTERRSFLRKELVRVDVQRAKDIIASPNIISVTYRGNSIHLDKVFESNSYVEGHYEDGTIVNAPVEELKES